MDEATWLQQRRLGLGGSDISSVVGLNPYSSPWHVYLDKIGAALPVRESVPMRLGKLVEPLLTALYTHRMRLREPLVSPGLLIDARRPWWRGTPDRLDRGQGLGLEFKYTNRYQAAREWGPSGSALVPLRHRLQCAWYLELTGYERWELMVCIGHEDALAAAGWELALMGEDRVDGAWLDRLWQELDLRLYPIAPDRELTALLAEAGERFWTEHVVPQHPPPLDGSEAAQDYVRRQYPQVTAPVRLASAPEQALLQQYLTADASRDAWTGERDRLKVALQDAIGPARGIRGPDGVQANWPPVAGGAVVAWEALARALGATPEQIESCTTRRADTRRFTVDAPATAIRRTPNGQESTRSV